jgi:predicted NAD/FAD-binding protein
MPRVLPNSATGPGPPPRPAAAREPAPAPGAGRRIAVVGAGVAGLVAAHELRRAGHDVHLFEAGESLGGHANTVEVETAAGSRQVDTGFVVLNDRNYPNLNRLFDELGIATQPADMSFSVSDEEGRFEWATRPRGIFARPAHALDPRFHRMLADLVRFNREARDLVALDGEGPSLREFLAERRYSRHFVERLIVPQVSSIWSADPAELWSFPAGFLAAFLANHGLLQVRGRPRWRSVRGGSRRYVEAIARGLGGRAHPRAAVRSVERRPDGVELRFDDTVARFDEVVLAVHSDQALALLAAPSRLERELLGAIPYQANETVLHTDERLLPRRRAAWASWNYHLSAEPPGRTTITYDMCRLQSLRADRRFLVTLNRSEAIDPARTIRRFEYAHPVYTRAGVAAQRRWAELSGRDRVHYCGAYWRWGFHEDGVWSALRVSRALGGRGPLGAGEPRAEAPAPEAGARPAPEEALAS